MRGSLMNGTEFRERQEAADYVKEQADKLAEIAWRLKLHKGALLETAVHRIAANLGHVAARIDCNIYFERDR